MAAGCIRRSVRYSDIEQAVVAGTDRILRDCPRHPLTDDARARLLADIGRRLHELKSERSKIEQDQDALRQVKSAVATNLNAIDIEARRLRGQRNQLYRGRVMVIDPAMGAKLAELAACSKAVPIDVARINAALRGLLTQVVVDYANTSLIFHWKHGGTSKLPYSETRGPRRT